MTEDDTFERLRRSSYRTVWELCRVYINIDDGVERCRLVLATKKSCGWTENEFREEWDRLWSTWDTYDRR